MTTTGTCPSALGYHPAGSWCSGLGPLGWADPQSPPCPSQSKKMTIET